MQMDNLIIFHFGHDVKRGHDCSMSLAGQKTRCHSLSVRNGRFCPRARVYVN